MCRAVPPFLIVFTAQEMCEDTTSTQAFGSMAQVVRGGREKSFQCAYVCHDVSVVGTKGGAMLLPK